MHRQENDLTHALRSPFHGVAIAAVRPIRASTSKRALPIKVNVMMGEHMELEALLLSPANVDALMAKIITANEDSGRHGVLVPVGAYSMFPPIPDFQEDQRLNYTVPIRTIWRSGTGTSERASNYKHYHRYPERRITALGSRELDEGGSGTLVIVARRKDRPALFEVHVLRSDDNRTSQLLRELGFDAVKPGMYVLEREWKIARVLETSDTVAELLRRFDSLAALGKVPTLRPGPTGVGYTLEHHMGIPENNSNEADFNGVELKSIRSGEFRYDSPERTNLFLKEPRWIDSLDGISRVEAYGYEDDGGRNALYSCVTSTENSHGLRLRVDSAQHRVCIDYMGAEIGYYERAVLEKRLNEKLSEMLVVLADASGRGAHEHFVYHSVIHCAFPSVLELPRLIEEGHIFLELRMHVSEVDGKPRARNHGTGFRIRMSKWPELFGVVRAVRGPGKK